MRQSTVSSHSRLGQQNSQSATLQTLQNKKKEFETIAALEQSGARYISTLEEIATDLSTTAEATTAIGKAMDHWSNMFYILSLTLQNAANGEDPHTQTIVSFDYLLTNFNRKQRVEAKLCHRARPPLFRPYRGH